MKLKKILKKVLPNWLVDEIKIRKKSSYYKNLPIQETFSHIKDNNLWASEESVSGRGSEINSVKSVIKELEVLLQELKIKTILDAPCGDFNWMKEVRLDEIEYLGGDIVQDIIEDNKKKYSSKTVDFMVMDLTKNVIPEVDIIICRDCLVHFSYKNIYSALKKIKSSNSKYLLTTSFVDLKANKNIITGEWRMINLHAFPFNFPKAKKTINENYVRKNKYQDKSLVLYKISEIKFSIFQRLFFLISH